MSEEQFDDMSPEEAAEVGAHTSYVTTIIFGEAGRFTFADPLPEECVETCVHGVLSQGIDICVQPCVLRFVRPREVVLTEVSE